MSEHQHPESRSFESVADVYERVRPTYPKEAVEWLAEKLRIDRSSTVLDLGAGTGKLTRELVALARRVIAVEPGPAMLAELERAVPEAEAVLGAAEAIPLPDASVDAVTCAQSFHWFRQDEAMREIRRVTRADGWLGLIWNSRDSADELQQEVSALLRIVRPDRQPHRESVPPLVSAGLVRDVQSARFPFHDDLDADGVVARLSSTSFVAAAPEPQRDRFFAQLRAAVEARGGRVAFRYVTEAYAMRLT